MGLEGFRVLVGIRKSLGYMAWDEGFTSGVEWWLGILSGNLRRMS